MSSSIRRIFFSPTGDSFHKRNQRTLKFESLEERVVLNSAPILQNMPEVLNLMPGTSYHVALDGKDADNDHLTFTVQNSNTSLLNATVLEGNKSVKFTVYQKNTAGDWETVGTMVFELFEKEAPLTTKRFQEIVNGTTGVGGTIVSYDGVAIHRIIDGFMFQGGDVQYGNGTGGTGTKIPDEYNDLLQFTSRGIVATANANKRTDPDPTKWVNNTNDSQFFITDNETPWLDGKHNIFGFITEGDDVRKKVNEIPANASSGTPLKSVKTDDFEVFTDYENGTLRIVVPENAAAGHSTITVMVSDGVNEPVPYEITVNVLASRPKTAPAWSVPQTLELTPGQKYTFTLPEYGVFGQVDYYAEKIDGYSASDLKVTRNGREVTIEAPTTGGGLQWLAVGAEAADGDVQTSDPNSPSFGSKREYIALYIKPSAPKITLSELGDTGTTGDNVTAKNGSETGKELYFNITDVLPKYSIVNLYRGGYYVDTELIASTLQSNGLYTMTLKVKQSAAQSLEDGVYAYTATQVYTPPQDVIAHDPMISSVSASLAVVIDTKNPVFTSPSGANLFDAKVGEKLEIDFRTDDHTAGKTKYVIDSIQNGNGTPIQTPTGLSIDAATGELTWTPTATQVDDYKITIKATDGAGNSATKTVDVAFQGGLEFSITGTSTLDENGEFVLNLAPIDTEFDGILTYELKEGSLPVGTVYSLDKTGDSTAVFKWKTNEADGPGTYTLVFTVKDDDGNARRKDVVLTVNEVAVEPEFTNQFKNVYDIDENKPFSLQLTATDSDIYPGATNPLTYSIVGNKPSGFSINESTGLVTWTPGEDSGGFNFEVTVRVTDKTGLYDEKTLRFFVKEDDSAPVFDEGQTSFERNTGQNFSTTVTANDPDYSINPGTPLHQVVYTLEGDDIPEGMTIDGETGRISWDIPKEYLASDVMHGTVSITVKAQEYYTEGSGNEYHLVLGLSSTKTIEISLTNQEIIDAIAEEAARQSAGRQTFDLQRPDRLSLSNSLWMLTFEQGRPTFGYVSQINLGQTPTSLWGGTINRFQIGIDGTHGKLNNEDKDKKPQKKEDEKDQKSETINPENGTTQEDKKANPRQNRQRAGTNQKGTAPTLPTLSSVDWNLISDPEMIDWQFIDQASDYSNEHDLAYAAEHVAEEYAGEQTPEMKEMIALLVPEVSAE